MCCLMMHMKAVESWSEAEADNVERDVIMNVMGPFKIYCNQRIVQALAGITVVPPGKDLAQTVPLSMPICSRQHKMVRVCASSVHPSIHPSIQAHRASTTHCRRKTISASQLARRTKRLSAPLPSHFPNSHSRRCVWLLLCGCVERCACLHSCASIHQCQIDAQRLLTNLGSGATCHLMVKYHGHKSVATFGNGVRANRQWRPFRFMPGKLPPSPSIHLFIHRFICASVHPSMLRPSLSCPHSSCVSVRLSIRVSVRLSSRPEPTWAATGLYGNGEGDVGLPAHLSVSIRPSTHPSCPPPNAANCTCCPCSPKILVVARVEGLVGHQVLGQIIIILGCLTMLTCRCG